MISSLDCSRAARQAGSVSVADQAWALLLQVAFERVQAHFAAAVAELDLAPMQAKALHELDVEPPISMRELAERLRSDPSNVTGLIDRLEARGPVGPCGARAPRSFVELRPVGLSQQFEGEPERPNVRVASVDGDKPAVDWAGSEA